MRIILTVTILDTDYSLDIQVNEEQKIIDTLSVLSHNLPTKSAPVSEIKYVRSVRTKRRINTQYSYNQAKIHTGDHLLI